MVSAPFGWQSDGTMMVWSNDGDYIDLVSTKKISTNEWHNVVIAADGETADFYIDGVKVQTGKISDSITQSTDTYLAVNYWDTPFNGAIDNLLVFNGTHLTADQIVLLQNN